MAQRVYCPCGQLRSPWALSVTQSSESKITQYPLHARDRAEGRNRDADIGGGRGKARAKKGLWNQAALHSHPTHPQALQPWEMS